MGLNFDDYPGFQHKITPALYTLNLHSSIILGLMIGRVVWLNPYFQIWTSNIKKKESKIVRRKRQQIVLCLKLT